jgi:Zn-dependent oligopeptidase
MKHNPLISDFNTYLGTAPFSDIQPAHFKPAVKQLIAEAKQDIQNITDNNNEASFENTIEALEYSGLQLSVVQNILMNINSAETNDEWQKTTEEVLPLLNDFYNDIRQNKALFERIAKVKETSNPEDLTPEQQMLLDKTYKSFVRNGANLDEGKQEELKKIDQELTQLKLQFNKNVLKETNDFLLVIDNETDLEGLPGSAKQAARQLAKSKGKSGWAFSLHAPSYIPFMKYIKNRDLRQQMALAYGSRSFKDNEYNNSDIVLNIAKLRQQRAQLLGYNTHADYVLEERMAETPKKVIDFLDQLYQAAYPKAQVELKKLENLAQKDGIDKLEKWDVSYYMNILKKQELDLDEEQLKAYFPLENVLKGIFEIANKLYGLTFKETDQIDKYHPDVKTFEVYDDQKNLTAVLYTDFFPRAGKRQGAWMTAYKPQWQKDGQNNRPHISIVTNFTPPIETEPSLLTFNEVTTLFHEFGHALHGMMAQTTYPSLSGTNVYWDFVELPSQIMENWAYEKEALDLFAKHYKSGEVIPQELIDSIKKSLQFMEGYATNRQLSFGYLDMGWHYYFNPEMDTNVSDFEEQQMAKTQILPYHKNNNMSVAFSHIFSGGYAAGYYSYKWAEVLDADAFAYFKEKGIFNKEVAKKFKKLLESGGTKHPMILYKEFRGREPKVEALLKRAGLI